MLLMKARQLWMEPIEAVGDFVGILPQAQFALLRGEVSIKAQDAAKEVALRQ